VPFRVGRDFDAEPVAGFGADELDQFVGVAELAGLGHAGGQVAAQGDGAPDAGRLVFAEDLADAVAAGADAGQVRRGVKAFGGDFLDDREGALAGRAAGAVGDREEFRLQFCQFLTGGPQFFDAFGRLAAGKIRWRFLCSFVQPDEKFAVAVAAGNRAVQPGATVRPDFLAQNRKACASTSR
jgi:hypothetical protein